MPTENPILIDLVFCLVGAGLLERRRGADASNTAAASAVPAADDDLGPPPSKRTKLNSDSESTTQSTFARLHLVLNELSAEAAAVGLSASQLVAATELVPLFLAHPDRQVQTLLRKLPKKVLIPRQQVPFDAVVNMLGPLHQPSLRDDIKTRVAMLRWNALIVPLVSPQAALRTVYQLYFRVSTTTSHALLRLYAAQILFRITRKADVTASRVSILTRLLDSLSSTSPDPAAQFTASIGDISCLTSILSLYRDYRPDLVPTEQVQFDTVPSLSLPASPLSALSPNVLSPPLKSASPRIAPIQSCPDVQLWTAISRLRAQHAQTPVAIPGGLPSQEGLEASWPASRLSENPTVESRQPAPPTSSELKFSGFELAKFEDFVRHLGDKSLHDMAEVSMRKIASVAGSKWLQHWLLLDRNDTVAQRLSQWCQALLDDLFREKGAALSSHSMREQETALSVLVSIADTFHEVPSSVITFLRDFVKIWDGTSHFDTIIRLLRWLPPLPWEDLYSNLLRPLGKLIFSLVPSAQSAILDCFSELLRHWLQVNWFEYHKSLAASKPTIVDLGFTLNQAEAVQVDYYRTLFEFIRYVDHLASLALLSECPKSNAGFSDNVSIQHSILNFFDLVSRLHSRYALPFVVTPSPAIVYRCLLSSNAASLSRICGILARYKAEFDKLKTIMATGPGVVSVTTPADASALPLSFPNGAEKILVLNCYIWMFCGALWRQRLFIPPPEFLRDELRLPQHLLDTIRFEGVSACLGLTHAPSMLSLAKEYLSALHSALDNHGDGSVSQSAIVAAAAAAASGSVGLPGSKPIMKPEMIKDVVKEHYVDYLQQRRLTGLHHFLFSFIAALVRLQTGLHHQVSGASGPSDA